MIVKNKDRKNLYRVFEGHAVSEAETTAGTIKDLDQTTTTTTTEVTTSDDTTQKEMFTFVAEGNIDKEVTPTSHPFLKSTTSKAFEYK